MDEEFLSLKEGAIYFDSAATTHKPKSVGDAVLRYYKDECATVHRSVYESGAKVSKQYEGVRQQVKEFLHANDACEIVFTKNATEALNLLAYSLSSYCLGPGDEVIVTISEHHSNFVPWQEACKRVGAKFTVIGLNDQMQIDLDELKQKIGHKTKIVAVNHISNVLGVENPIAEIAAICKTTDTYLVVDGAQSVSHLEIDVQELGADFFVFSAHKMYGPTGVGVLWGKEKLLEAMPPFLFGGSMVDEVMLEASSFSEIPQKFEAGTPPIASVLGFGKAIEFVQKNRESICETKRLVHYLKQSLSEVFSSKITFFAGGHGILSFVHSEMHALDIATCLALDGICVRAGHHCAAPLLSYLKQTSLLRISLGIYNSKDEINRFIEYTQRMLLEVNG